MPDVAEQELRHYWITARTMREAMRQYPIDFATVEECRAELEVMVIHTRNAGLRVKAVDLLRRPDLADAICREIVG